jgi:hypothetical protein
MPQPPAKELTGGDGEADTVDGLELVAAQPV